MNADDIVVALDPGLNATGWSIWNHGVLSGCGLIRTSARSVVERAEQVVHKLLRELPYGEMVDLVYEKPQIYQQRKQKGDPNDLVDIAILIGVVVKGVPHHRVVGVEPRTWKGTIRKTRHLPDYKVHQRLTTGSWWTRTNPPAS